MMLSTAERTLLEALDQLFERSDIREAIDAIARDAATRLQQQPSEEMTWAPVPLDTYGATLPPALRSGWIFVIRRGITLTAHRHPNSIQRMMSYQGGGDFQTRTDADWQSHILTGDRDAPLTSRWISIPENVWHRAVVGDTDWVVVSFHTVVEQDLIEEQFDTVDPEKSIRKTYLSGSDGRVG